MANTLLAGTYSAMNSYPSQQQPDTVSDSTAETSVWSSLHVTWDMQQEPGLKDPERFSCTVFCYDWLCRAVGLWHSLHKWRVLSVGRPATQVTAEFDHTSMQPELYQGLGWCIAVTSSAVQTWSFTQSSAGPEGLKRRPCLIATMGSDEHETQ